DVDLEVVIDQQIMRLTDVFNFQIGSQILLNATPDSLVELHCGKVPMYTGRMGRRGNKIAICIEGRIEKQKG
ncbi:MAG: FliM/FliN family flagellar motor switch protein, partial [Pseudomonadota bacterium]